MRSFSRRLVVLFASPLGVFVLAALDSSVFFSLPFGIDAVVVIVAARRPGAWIVPLLAAAGSVTGAALTFWIGIKIGEQGWSDSFRRNVSRKFASGSSKAALYWPPGRSKSGPSLSLQRLPYAGLSASGSRLRSQQGTVAAFCSGSIPHSFRKWSRDALWSLRCSVFCQSSALSG